MGDIFLQSYAGQSTAELISMADQYRIDSLVLAFEEALDSKGVGARARVFYDHP